MEPALSAAIIYVDAPRSANTTRGKARETPLAFATLAGRSSLSWVIDATLAASVRRIAVIGAQPSPAVRAEIARRNDRGQIDIVDATADPLADLSRAVERLASAFSVEQERPLLMLPAEAPLVETNDIRQLLRQHRSERATATRVVFSKDAQSAAAADRSASRATDTHEGVGPVRSDVGTYVNAGIVCMDSSSLGPALRLVERRGDKCLRPVEAALALEAAGHRVASVDESERLRPMRTPRDRAESERELRRRIRFHWVERGVVMPSIDDVWIDADVEIGHGVTLRPGTMLEGRTMIGDGATIGPHTHVVSSSIGADSIVPQSSLRHVDLPPKSQIEPFSSLG